MPSGDQILGAGKTGLVNGRKAKTLLCFVSDFRTLGEIRTE